MIVYTHDNDVAGQHLAKLNVTNGCADRVCLWLYNYPTAGYLATLATGDTEDELTSHRRNGMLANLGAATVKRKPSR